MFTRGSSRRATAMVRSIIAAGRFGASPASEYRLHPEVLDDDFLDVAIALVEISDREQGIDSVFARLTDSKEQARR